MASVLTARRQRPRCLLVPGPCFPRFTACFRAFKHTQLGSTSVDGAWGVWEMEIPLTNRR